MDRVVLRVPTPDESSAGLGKHVTVTSVSLAIALIAIPVLNSASMHDGHTFVALPTTWLPSVGVYNRVRCHTLHILGDSCIIIQLSSVFGSSC